MQPRQIAQLIAAGRVALGAALLVKPDLVTKLWVGGEEGSRVGTRTMASGLGARDMAIGAGVLANLDSGAAKPWLLASAVSDLADLVATLRARNELATSKLAGTVVGAGGAAAVGFWLVLQDVK